MTDCGDVVSFRLGCRPLGALCESLGLGQRNRSELLGKARQLLASQRILIRSSAADEN